MPTTSAPTTSQRLLALLSLLQLRRDWPGPLLAQRLQVSERTVRRDVERLRELDYAVLATRGPDGGYRLDASTRMPPLLFDDEQVVALAVALRNALVTGAGIEEAAARALVTVRQVMPARLRGRLDALEFTVGDDGPGSQPQVDTEVLVTIATAVRAREELRFDYGAPGGTGAAPGDVGVRPPRRAQPHHLVVRHGRWYVVAWDPERADWRSYRVDRMRLRVPNGPRFVRREVPGGDVATFLAARFRGSTGGDGWPCEGEVVLDLPVAEVLPHVGDALVEPLGTGRCRLRLGAWSWPALAATLARFDADLEVVGPPELVDAFAGLARRAARAARG